MTTRTGWLTVAAAALLLGGGSAARALADEKHVVTQKGKSFSATQLSVKVGEVVQFRNDDDVAHNAFSMTRGQAFNTKIQPPGSTADVSFATEGTVEVRCAIHPQMRLTVSVTR